MDAVPCAALSIPAFGSHLVVWTEALKYRLCCGMREILIYILIQIEPRVCLEGVDNKITL